MDHSYAKYKYNKLKILITGPNGNIASNLINELPKKYEIYTISSKKITKKNKIKSNLIYEGNYNKLRRFLNDINPKIVVHLSTKWKKFDEKKNEDLINSNITFGSYLLDICKNLDIKLFINTSSYTQFDSNGNYKPFNFYSASKEAFLKLLYYFYISKSFKIINLRIMNVYGLKNDKRIVNYIFQNIKNKKKKININDLNAYVDLVHIDDVVSALLSVILSKNYNYYKKFSYDISSKKQITILNLIKKIEKVSNYKFNKIISKKIFDEYLKKPYRGKRLINWDNKIHLKDGLKKNYYLFFPLSI